jgi:hypothetical protein
MKTTHQVSAGSHTLLGLFMKRAVAARSPYSRVIAQMPGHALRVQSTRSTRRRRMPRHACLVRRTGRDAGWREWRQNRARANRYSQEERVTSHL